MIKTITSIMSNFADIEENWIKEDPLTIPHVLYISTDKNNIKIGTGKNWSSINYLVTSSIPVGTLIYNVFKSIPEGYLRLDGELYNRTIYKQLFDHAVYNKMILPENIWSSDPKNHGYFSYSDDDLHFRLPKVDSMMLRTWLENGIRTSSDKPGCYQHGTLVGIDITSTGKMLYSVQLDSTNVARDIGIDQPLICTSAKAPNMSGIVESPTKQGNIVGSMRPETISYPLFIKY